MRKPYRLSVVFTLLLLSQAAHAQTGAAGPNYPAKAVRVLVGFAPGGGIDAIARFFSQKLTESLGQPFVVENRPGATGSIAADVVAKAQPDGYTLLATSQVHAINASVLTKLPFDPVRDFAPIASFAMTPDCIAVHPSMPAKTLRELIAMAKAAPQQISYASAGSGTLMHVGMELFNSLAGIKLLHIPYNGAGPSTIATLGGQVPVLSTSLGAALPHVKVRKLRMLAVTSAARTQLAPEFPTVAEAAGLKGYEAVVWIGLLAPAAAPTPVINKLNSEIDRLLKQPQVREQLASREFYDPYPLSPTAFANLIKSDIVKWANVVRSVGAKLD